MLTSQSAALFIHTRVGLLLSGCPFLSSKELNSSVRNHAIFHFMGFYGIKKKKKKLYKCLKFSKEWVCDFYPAPHHYLLVERSNSCTFSISLKSIWLKSSCVNTRKGAWWTCRTVFLWVLLMKKIQVHWLSYSLWRIPIIFLKKNPSCLLDSIYITILFVFFLFIFYLLYNFSWVGRIREASSLWF